MSGGKKKQGQQGQKHQNKTAFKIMFNPLALEIHKKVSFRGLCKRCSDQISWKLQYNKYKRMTEPSRCALCHQKNVLRTYMTACEPCSEALKICPKCLDPESEEQVEVRLTEKQQKRIDEESERKMNDFIKTLKERSRRTVKRLYEKGTITWDPQLNNFLDQEGNTLPLQFRQGYGANVSNAGGDQEQIDEFGDEDQDQEQEEIDEDDEQEKSNKNKESKKKASKEKTDKQDQDQEQQDEENSQQLDEGQDQDYQQDDQDGQNEVQQKTQSQQQKQSIPANQNEQDWQDVDEEQEQEQDEDDNQEQQQSEKEQELHKKKRKPPTHHHRKHRK